MTLLTRFFNNLDQINVIVESNLGQIDFYPSSNCGVIHFRENELIDTTRWKDKLKKLMKVRCHFSVMPIIIFQPYNA